MTITIKPGECFKTPAFTEEQVRDLHRIMERTAKRDEDGCSGEDADYALRNVHRFPYFGLDQRDNTTFTWNQVGEDSRPFHTDITDQLLKELNTMSTPFPVDTKVVANGFRNSKNDRNEHHYGTNGAMRRWVDERTVLNVVRADGERILVRPVEGGEVATFHPTELRLAAEKEIVETPSLPQANDVVKTEHGIVLVLSGRIDSDGDMNVRSLLNDQSADYLRVQGRRKQDYTILGRFNEAGEFVRADAPQEPRKWKKGQQVHCLEGAAYISTGNTYTLIEDASTTRGDVVRIRILDNDGDPATYNASQFRAAA